MISELVKFDGGLSTKTSAHLIAKNEGIICENVDLESGTLKPLSSLQFVENVNGKHIYTYSDVVIANQAIADDRFYDEYAGNLYWSNNGYNTTGLLKYDGTNVGASADAPDPYPNSGSTLVSLGQVAATGISGLTNPADYTYAITVTDGNGIESTPVFIGTSSITTDNKSITLSVDQLGIDAYFAANPNYTVSVYRQGGANPTFNLIVDELIPTHPNVTTSGSNYVYTDNLADIDVSRIELNTYENTKTPEDIDMFIESKGTFWGAYGRKIYFSKTGNPIFWSPLDYIQLDKPCTGLGKFGDSIVAFTKTSSYLISGYNRDNVVAERMPFNQGCINKHSVVNIDAYLVWTSMNGICLFDGSNIQVLTKNTLAWDEFGRLGNATYDEFNNTTSKWASDLGFDIAYAAGYKDKYYGVFKDGIVILDLADQMKVSTIATDGVASVSVNLDDNMLYATVEQTNGTFDVYALIDSDSKMTATWKTGRLTDGSVDVVKHYREVELEGEPVSVEVFIDGVSKYLSEGKSRFKLPSGLFGKDIQFEIKTVNEIRGIKYDYSSLRA